LQTTSAVNYPVRGYVNRLESPRDVRRLICDGLASRCQFRPQGFEVRPGVWMGQGAQVEKGARIVAPAFIGRGAKIADQCLITRGSNVESNSHVDYGTVVEDSSVLSNTYVGIGLDLTHSIVDGNSLLNLEHQVMLRIADPVVLRQVRESRERVETDGRLLASLDFGEKVSPTAEEKR
jgi:NDP-sugar pyrophosphorylase family protein